MSEFDDVIEREPKKPLSENKRDAKGNHKQESTQREPPSISLSSLLDDEPLLAELTDNINPELKNQVLIPLLNIVEKYGFADNLVASERTQTSLALVGVLTDVAPVLKGLSNYLEGHKNNLNESDKEFLQNLRDLDSSDDLEGLFNADEEIVIESEAQKHPLIGTLPNIDISQGKIDWMKVMDPDGVYSGDKRITQDYTIDDELVLPNNDSPLPKINLPSISELAAAAGVDLDNIKEIAPPSIRDEPVSISQPLSDKISPVNIDEFLEYSEDDSELSDESITQPPSVDGVWPSNPKPVLNTPLDWEMDDASLGLNDEDE